MSVVHDLKLWVLFEIQLQLSKKERSLVDSLPNPSSSGQLVREHTKCFIVKHETVDWNPGSAFADGWPGCQRSMIAY